MYLDNLKRHAFNEDLFKFFIDSLSQNIALFFPLGPEIVGSELTYFGSYFRVYEGIHGGLIALLISTIEVRDAILLDSVLKRD